MADETTKYKGQEVTWDQLVKKLGVDQARVAAPELDPKYQELVKKEGQAKGSADYSHQYIDPSTVSAKGWGGFGSLPEQELGLRAEEGRGGLLPGIETGLSKAIIGGLGGGGKGLGSALFGGGPPDPTKGGGKGGGGGGGGTTTGKETLQQAEDQAINQMYQGVLSQFQSAANTVNPYISGQAFSGQSQSAQALAQKYAGGGVEGPDPAIQGALSKDFAAQGAANTAGQQGVATAIQGMNQASQAQANVSPYSQLLNALATHAQSQIIYNNAQPNATQAPGYVSQALAASNALTAGTPGATTVGTTPVAPTTTTSGTGVAPASTGTAGGST